MGGDKKRGYPSDCRDAVHTCGGSWSATNSGRSVQPSGGMTTPRPSDIPEDIQLIVRDPPMKMEESERMRSTTNLRAETSLREMNFTNSRCKCCTLKCGVVDVRSFQTRIPTRFFPTAHLRLGCINTALIRCRMTAFAQVGRGPQAPVFASSQP